MRLWNEGKMAKMLAMGDGKFSINALKKTTANNRKENRLIKTCKVLF